MSPSPDPLDDWRPMPSRAELAAHHAMHAKRGGSWWVTIYPDEVEKGRDPYVWYSVGDRVYGTGGACGLPSPSALWSPRDARLMPVAWPSTSPMDCTP